MILSIDPGVKITFALLDTTNKKLLDAFEFKKPYNKELCERSFELYNELDDFLAEQISRLQTEKSISLTEIDKILLEVPWSISQKDKSCMYVRNDPLRTVKLCTTVIMLYIKLKEIFYKTEVILIPAKIWQKDIKSYEQKKELCPIEVKSCKSNDHLLDSVLMSFIYFENKWIQERCQRLLEINF